MEMGEVIPPTRHVSVERASRMPRCAAIALLWLAGCSPISPVHHETQASTAGDAGTRDAQPSERLPDAAANGGGAAGNASASEPPQLADMATLCAAHADGERFCDGDSG